MRIGDWSSDVCSSDLLFHIECREASPRVRALPFGGGLAQRRPAVVEHRDRDRQAENRRRVIGLFEPARAGPKRQVGNAPRAREAHAGVGAREVGLGRRPPKPARAFYWPEGATGSGRARWVERRVGQGWVST